MKTALYGGTFNPPHIGHLLAVKTISTLFDRVIVMPAAIPPHKALPEDSLRDIERLQLAQLTFGGFNNVEVSNFEITKGGVSYTIDTINALNCDDLTLVVGTDMLLYFEKWYKFEEVFKRAEVAVLRRDERGVEDHAQYLRERYGAKITIIDAKIVDISSSELRGFAPRLKVLETISPKRLAHSLGTEYEAVKLAGRYGVCEKEAALAALLHDCTKHWATEKHLHFCEECNIMLDDSFIKSAKLLHGITAAEFARREFSVSGSVYTAIRHHTLGRANMSKLEMIIYLADKLEPTREYKDVAEFREIAYKSMERAMLAVLDMSINKLVREKLFIHPATVDARNYYLGAEL